jgi:hypothetical protein
MGSLTDRTSDDALLIKWIQWIFRNCNVRLLRTPAPIRLVVQESRPPDPSQNRSGKIMPA